MNKAFSVVMMCFFSMAFATAALAIQPSLAPSSSSVMTWTHEQLTQFSGKSLTSAYVGVDVANNISDLDLNQSYRDNSDLLHSSMQTSLNGQIPLTLALQQLHKSVSTASKEINHRGVYAAEPASVAIVCAVLIALPFARRVRNMLQRT